MMDQPALLEKEHKITFYILGCPPSQENSGNEGLGWDSRS